MAKNAKGLIADTTQTSTADSSSPRFTVGRNEIGVLRSTNLDGSAVVALYYVSPKIPDGPAQKFDNPATDDDGNAVTLTPTNPERMINVPGTYTVAVTTAANTQGIVFAEVT